MTTAPATATAPAQTQTQPAGTPAAATTAPATVTPATTTATTTTATTVPVTQQPGSLLNAKPDEQTPPAAPVKPDYSKLKLPDGTKLQQADFDAMKAWGEKNNLTPEALQTAIDDRSGALKTYHDGLVTEYQQKVAANRKMVEEHPTLGGKNLKATDEAVTQVLTRFAPKGLMERIQQAGYQWDPDFLQMLMNIRAATKDDTFVPSGGAPNTQPKSKGLESMYEPKPK